MGAGLGEDGSVKCAGGVPTVMWHQREDRSVSVHGMFVEKADQESGLLAQLRSSGVHIHELSGWVNLRVRDPFEEIKVIVKRGEVDWVHFVPSPEWVSQQIAIIKVVKMCRVAHRRNILWSVANPVNSILWACNEISPLWEVGCVHCVVCSGVQVVTNVHWWRSDMNSQQVVDAFKEHLNLEVPDHTVADLTITGDRVTGRGAPESQRVVREDENEAAIGGLRNAARAVDRVPGWKVVGRKVAKIIEELVNKHPEVLDTVLSRLGDKVRSPLASQRPSHLVEFSQQYLRRALAKSGTGSDI